MKFWNEPKTALGAMQCARAANRGLVFFRSETFGRRKPEASNLLPPSIIVPKEAKTGKGKHCASCVCRARRMASRRIGMTTPVSLPAAGADSHSEAVWRRAVPKTIVGPLLPAPAFSGLVIRR